MFKVQLNDEVTVDASGTSDGTQVKYYQDGYWYKIDMLGNEGEVEYLCSGILKFSTLKKSEFVVYERGLINDKNGCRSKNFLKGEETFITFNRLHKNIYGIPMHEKINRLNSLEEKIEYVKYFVQSICNIDVTDYLKKTFTLDFIILNEDRHFNNLGIVMKADGSYRTAPIFDNGKSLLNGNYSVKRNMPIAENVKRVISRPFGGTHIKVMKYLGKGFDIDFDSAVEWLEKQADSYSKEVLKYQIKEFEKIMK